MKTVLKTITEQEEKENTPEKISEKILELKARYLDRDLIDQAFTAIKSTRASNKISDGVFLAVLQKCDRYPVNQVESVIRIYLEKNCAADGKNEKYLLGIIKNQNGARESNQKRTPGWL